MILLTQHLENLITYWINFRSVLLITILWGLMGVMLTTGTKEFIINIYTEESILLSYTPVEGRIVKL